MLTVIAYCYRIWTINPVVADVVVVFVYLFRLKIKIGWEIHFYALHLRWFEREYSARSGTEPLGRERLCQTNKIIKWKKQLPYIDCCVFNIQVCMDGPASSGRESEWASLRTNEKERTTANIKYAFLPSCFAASVLRVYGEYWVLLCTKRVHVFVSIQLFVCTGKIMIPYALIHTT